VKAKCLAEPVIGFDKGNSCRLVLSGIEGWDVRIYINPEQGGGTMSTKTNLNELMLHIAEIVIRELKLEDVTPETFDPEIDLVDEVGIDSMDLATVALVLQDEYAIRIDEDDYPKLTNIRLIAENIFQKLAERSETKAA
jgi:acyl carrier protein